MGSEDTTDPCLRLVTKKDGTHFYENICKTKVMCASAGGTGLGGPKYRYVMVAGDADLVDQVMKPFMEKSY
jgi:hypothetical protein